VTTGSHPDGGTEVNVELAEGMSAFRPFQGVSGCLLTSSNYLADFAFCPYMSQHVS